MVKLNKKHKALFAITACVLFWGFSFISTKIVLAVFPPMSLGMLRIFAAIIILYIIKQKHAPAEKLKLKDIPMLFIAGITGVTLYFFFENNGVLLVSASEASIVVSSIPALLIITEFVIGKIKEKFNMVDLHIHKIRIGQWIGCFISIAGVWLVAGVSFAISGSIAGYLYLTGAAFSWVAYSFLTRSLFKKHSVIFIVFWQVVAGFICFIPFAAAEIQNWGTPEITVIAHLLFLGIFCSAVSQWFFVYAMERLSVTVTGIFLNVIPVVTVAAGFFVLGERLTLLQGLGASLVICGVTLAMGSSTPPHS